MSYSIKRMNIRIIFDNSHEWNMLLLFALHLTLHDMIVSIRNSLFSLIVSYQSYQVSCLFSQHLTILLIRIITSCVFFTRDSGARESAHVSYVTSVPLLSVQGQKLEAQGSIYHCN